MRRRVFMVIAIGAAIVPWAGRSQGSRTWRIAMLDTASRDLNRRNLEAFSNQLRQLGYSEGQNVILDYRYATGRNERSRAVSELISLNPDVIVVRGTPEVVAVKNATATIPVVMSAVGDPVDAGVAASLARPGGNITGMSSFVAELGPKRVDYLKQMVPSLRRLAFVNDFRNLVIQNEWREVQAAARSLGIEALPLDVRSAEEVVRAFDAAANQGVQAIRVGVDGTRRPNRPLILELAAKYKLPAIYAERDSLKRVGLCPTLLTMLTFTRAPRRS